MLDLCTVARNGDTTQIEYKGARAKVTPSAAYLNAVKADRINGTKKARLQDPWAYTIPAAETYTHPTREGAENLAARHLVNEMDFQLPPGNDALSLVDRCQLARIIMRRETNQTPRTGDFLEMADGTRERLCERWPDEGWQTYPAGSFHLGKWGGATHSGSLNGIAPGSAYLVKVGEALGRFWIWRDGISGAHRGVYVFAPVTVWKAKESE